MEEKKFFDAFPTLQLNKELTGIFAEAVVYHISMNSKRTCVKIYIKFNRLIGRDVLTKIEAEMKRQIKPFFAMEVHIIERFELSSLHNAQTIMEQYRESILFELKRKNMIMLQLFREAKINIKNENEIEFILKDNFVSKEYSEELKIAIEEMFLNRFSMEQKVLFKYIEVDESRHSKEAEYKMNQLV